ncbi:hypothetical protein RB595_001944 [Gaeumannomyces hyphopodioides]
MVKADYNRDYYADLDLPQTADVNDVKKQFRKLALKYHPDRNPGRESEVNSKFQTIQTAHEILASPESKAKYDANRARSGRFPTSSGVRGNPWQDIAKDFPPPPQRNANNHRSNTSSRSSASAARYAKFPVNTPPPPPPRPQDNDDAKSRAEAFESMRFHGRKAAPTAPQPNSSAGASRPRPPPPDPRQTAYTASQREKAEASFGTRTPRASRSGFVPGSPMGDEAPVSSKHYATKRHTSLFEDTASAYQKPQASAPSSDHDDGGPRPFLDPRSSPYGGVRGERFDPFSGTKLGRAGSTREIPRKPVGGDANAFGATTHRQRSFSVSDDADSPSKAAEGRRGSEANPGKAYHANTSARMPSSPTPSRFGERYTPKPSFQGGDDASSSGASAAANFGSEKANSATGRTNGGQPNVYPTPGHRSAESLTPNANESRFMRNSADNINTRFVAEEHANANWQFNAGNEENDENGSGPRRSQSQSGNRGRRSPPKNRPQSRSAGMAAAAAAAAAAGMAAEAFMSSGADAPNGPADSEQQPQKDQHRFDADQWREKIGSEHFVPVAPPRSATSPTRGNRSGKRRTKVHMTKGGSAGLMDDDETTSGEEKPAGAPLNGGGADSDNAMDIDTPMGDASPIPQVNGVRGVPLEPSRPEWRAGDANGFAGASPGSGASPTPGIGLGLNIGSPSAVPPLPPKIPVNEQARFNTSNAAGSEDTDDLGANFADLKNVEPLAQRPSGLGSFEDLKTTLPFESQAAATPPLDRPSVRPQGKITFPKPPMPPRPPTAFGIPSMTPNRSAWDKYVAEFEVYLREWDVVDAMFLDHMITRQGNTKKMKQKGWSAVASDEGMQQYYAWLEEDKQVHEKWTAYSNEHHRRVREFMAHKEKMKASF